MAISSDLRKTYAIAVGIELYEDEKWFLPGAAGDAVLWVNYLLSHHIPHGNIQLLIDAKDERATCKELTDTRVARRSATHDAFRNAIEELQGKSGNLLIYWSGHGGVNPHNGERRLFYSESLRNLSVEQMQLALHSELYKDISAQVFIIDACAAYYPTQAAETIHRGEQTTGIEQLLIAPPVGELSRNSHANGGGEFSQNLRALLKTEGWPPDFDRISKEILNPATARTVSATPREQPRGLRTLLLCDRKEPAQKFQDALKGHLTAASPWPLVHLVHADGGELHRDFVERVMYDAAEQLEAGDPELIRLEWNDRYPILLDALFDYFHGKDSKREPEEFRKLAKRPIIPIYHEILNWNAETPGALRQYLEFWKRYEAGNGGSPVLVFLGVHYPPPPVASGPRLVRWFDKWKWKRRKKKIQQGFPAEVGSRRFLELDKVPRWEVMQFLGKFDMTEARRSNIVKVIFGQHQSLPMADIEPKLEEMLHGKGGLIR